MKNRLRTAEEGADIVVWLALSDAALKQTNGLFFQGLRKFMFLMKEQHFYTHENKV
jgi:hypothetical protein